MSTVFTHGDKFVGSIYTFIFILCFSDFTVYCQINTYIVKHGKC